MVIYVPALIHSNVQGIDLEDLLACKSLALLRTLRPIRNRSHTYIRGQILYYATVIALIQCQVGHAWFS